MSFLRFHDQRDLERINERDPKWIQFKKFVKGVHVSVSTLRSGKTRPIKDVVLNAGNVTFEKDGIMTTVKVRTLLKYEGCSAQSFLSQDHFQQHHNIALRFPAMFGVRIGKDAVFPAEICDVIPGQLYRKKLSPEATVTFLKFSTQKPDARLRTIKEAVAGPVCTLCFPIHEKKMISVYSRNKSLTIIHRTLYGRLEWRCNRSPYPSMEDS